MVEDEAVEWGMEEEILKVTFESILWTSRGLEEVFHVSELDVKQGGKNRVGTALDRRNTGAQARGTTLSPVESRKLDKMRGNRRLIGVTPVTLRELPDRHWFKPVHLGVRVESVTQPAKCRCQTLELLVKRQLQDSELKG
ncbi:hypothetical protein HAX54_017202 [Datura stramonium]|uniref:Uncharacterized protein n=1 Tax=Datura stramonium TaxID=4076 RepID=A0ABS8S095_DATST|nr:hypothetical protein [Datura stramonium]